MDNNYVMRVKGKVLNQFLGFMKTDIARLSVEGFPETINRQLISLTLLNKQDLCWFDIQIEKRIATLRANFFVGENGGNKIFKVGILCLIGIAHLTEQQRGMKYYKKFELRPQFTRNLESFILEELSDMPEDVASIVWNLFHAIKLVCSRVLIHIPISGNVIVCSNGVLMSQHTGKFKGSNTLEFETKADAADASLKMIQIQNEMQQTIEHMKDDVERGMNNVTIRTKKGSIPLSPKVINEVGNRGMEEKENLFQY